MQCDEESVYNDRTVLGISVRQLVVYCGTYTSYQGSFTALLSMTICVLSHDRLNVTDAADTRTWQVHREERLQKNHSAALSICQEEGFEDLSCGITGANDAIIDEGAHTFQARKPMSVPDGRDYLAYETRQ